MSIDTGLDALNVMALAAGCRQAPDKIEGTTTYPFAFVYVSKLDADKMVNRWLVTYTMQIHANGEMTGRSMDTLRGIVIALSQAIVNDLTLGGAVAHIGIGDGVPMFSASFGPSNWAGANTYAAVITIPAKVLIT